MHAHLPADLRPQPLPPLKRQPRSWQSGVAATSFFGGRRERPSSRPARHLPLWATAARWSDRGDRGARRPARGPRAVPDRIRRARAAPVPGRHRAAGWRRTSWSWTTRRVPAAAADHAGDPGRCRAGRAVAGRLVRASALRRQRGRAVLDLRLVDAMPMLWAAFVPARS